MSPDPGLVLDMLLAARKVRRFNAGISAEQFAQDEMRQSATRYQLQVIGEAAWKVSGEFRAAHPNIPWDKIAGLRHRLVHEYATIDSGKVWQIVERHIDELIAALEPLVPPES